MGALWWFSAMWALWPLGSRLSSRTHREPSGCLWASGAASQFYHWVCCFSLSAYPEILRSLSVLSWSPSFSFVSLSGVARNNQPAPLFSIFPQTVQVLHIESLNSLLFTIRWVRIINAFVPIICQRVHKWVFTVLHASSRGFRNSANWKASSRYLKHSSFCCSRPTTPFHRPC